MFRFERARLSAVPYRSAVNPALAAEVDARAIRQSAILVAMVLFVVPCVAQFHRAEQSREIRYWLLDPATHQFRISHDFTISRPGQKYVHSFVRKGSKVSPDAKIYCIDTGSELKTSNVSGKEVNALGYYPNPTDPESVVVQ